MRTPAISICSTAFRPQNWMALYNSLGRNEVDFEMVFVGPNSPTFTLPENFTFIKSNVKPAQCFEIATRNSTGRLMMQVADDVEFKTERPLDKLYTAYHSYSNEKLILSCRFRRDGKVFPLENHRIFPLKNAPFMPMCGLTSRKLYMDTGGADKRFIAVMFDIDIFMRILDIGGEVKFSDVVVEEFKNRSRGSDLCYEFWKHDRGLLGELWLNEGNVSFKRSMPVEPFSDYRIVENSQGPRGRWRGKSFYLLEKLEDDLYIIKRDLVRVKQLAQNPKNYKNFLKQTILRVFPFLKNRKAT